MKYKLTTGMEVLKDLRNNMLKYPKIISWILRYFVALTAIYGDLLKIFPIKRNTIVASHKCILYWENTLGIHIFCELDSYSGFL